MNSGKREAKAERQGRPDERNNSFNQKEKHQVFNRKNDDRSNVNFTASKPTDVNWCDAGDNSAGSFGSLISIDKNRLKAKPSYTTSHKNRTS